MAFDEPSTAQNDATKKSPENVSSRLNLVSISQSDNATEQSSATGIDTLTTAANDILGDYADHSKESPGFSPTRLAPESLYMSDPFEEIASKGPADQCGPQAEAQKAQATPEETAKKAIEKLSAEIQRIENSPTEIGKWAHGTVLHDLAQYQTFLGLHAEASKNSRQSMEILRKELANQPNKEAAERAFMLASFDYGQSLVQPKGGIQPMLADRQEADKSFADTLALAEKYKVPAIQQADLYREKLANLVMIAQRHNLQTPEGNAAYRQEMQTIIDTYKKPLALQANDVSNDGKASRALTNGDLAWAEKKRTESLPEAARPTDADTISAATHYEEALKFWKGYDPKIGTTSDAQAKSRQDYVDKALLVVLPQYWDLLKKQNTPASLKRADEINKQYVDIVDRHPGIIIKKEPRMAVPQDGDSLEVRQKSLEQLYPPGERKQAVESVVRRGISLSHLASSNLSLEEKRNSSRTADELYEQSVRLAERWAQSPTLQARILDNKGFNEVNLASSYADPVTRRPANEKDLQSYQTEMLKAIETFKTGEHLLALQNPDQDIAHKISIHGNLAAAEMGMAIEKDDKFAVACENDYLEGVRLWGQSTNTPVNAAERAQVDRMIFDRVLRSDRYPALLEATGRKAERNEVMARNKELRDKYGFKDPAAEREEALKRTRKSA